MRFCIITVLSALAVSGSSAAQDPHGRAKKYAIPKRGQSAQPRSSRGAVDCFKHLTKKTEPFAVNGTGIPEVNFDVGESYAGTLPITDNATDPNQFFFWFFPSNNSAADNEIVIWLNGGPGCSSLDGFFQENGPFLWLSGTYSPIENPFSWHKLTNMVWVDQPVGTGLGSFDPDYPRTLRSEDDVARDFAGFWKNFIDTFDFQGRDVYFTGESYAGQYIPYIASHFLDLNDTDYYKVKGIQINDPSIADDEVLISVPAAQYLNNNLNLFNFNQSTIDTVNQLDTSCGYTKWLDTALTFPPTGKTETPGCKIDDPWEIIITAALWVNPCFNIYHVTDYCPFLWDELGFPSHGWGPNNYFNRSDVQTALNLKSPVSYAVCGDDTLGPIGLSAPSSWSILPSVIERTNNVIVGNGNLDFLIMSNGTLAALNNMTFNGAQGFEKAPSDEFYVPYSDSLYKAMEVIETQVPIPSLPVGLLGGGGRYGVTHTERGLTWVTVDLAGHEIPQYVPGAGYRQLEFLLGRIDSLSEPGDFTIPI
ncbi:alpha/beta-hydrolase [Xylariaceae sp. FL1019]|nr:alpha/beta-hydrolase [Xylariaceae sp. FL1019]